MLHGKILHFHTFTPPLWEKIKREKYLKNRFVSVFLCLCTHTRKNSFLSSGKNGKRRKYHNVILLMSVAFISFLNANTTYLPTGHCTKTK